ncbi:MAG: hypothetical protein M3331_04420, partial [Actinomycetota bacterium]|nr:hypothetical protein [Actinomycetota bacterium]
MKDYELAGLPDEQLIAYVARARRAGAIDAAKLGLSVFAFRRHDDLVRRALAKMPTREDAEDVAAQTIRDIFKAAFDGESVGEAFNFTKRILGRRIADWHEARKPTDALPEDLSDDERRRRDAAISPDDTGGVDAQDAIDRQLEELSGPHRMVVEEWLAGYRAKENAE